MGLLLFSSVAGCAHQQRRENIDPASLHNAVEAIEHFSENPPGALPHHWEPMVIFRNKKQTDYQLVTEYGKTILHARAANASSGLMQHVNIDSVTQPWLSWRWKIGEQADAPMRRRMKLKIRRRALFLDLMATRTTCRS